MKKITTILLTIVCVLSMVFSVSCSNTFEGKYTLVINIGEENTEYAIDTEVMGVDTLADALEYLRDNYDVTYEYVDSIYGINITKLGDIEPQGYTQWVKIYTSVESDRDVSEYSDSMEYRGVTLYTSGYGVSSMTLVEGCVVYFTLGETNA